MSRKRLQKLVGVRSRVFYDSDEGEENINIEGKVDVKVEDQELEDKEEEHKQVGQPMVNAIAKDVTRALWDLVRSDRGNMDLDDLLPKWKC